MKHTVVIAILAIVALTGCSLTTPQTMATADPVEVAKIVAASLTAMAPPPSPTPVPPESTATPVVVTATQQPVPVQPNTQVVELSGGQCVLDKIGTWSEGGGAFRIEVGGHGVQHMDFYPSPGVKAVSYIVGAITPPQVPAIWWGYGSNWEGNPVGCTYDWVTDATSYAQARLDSGHSGLVVDLRFGTPQVVANVLGLSGEEIQNLLGVHAAAQESLKAYSN